MRRTILLLAVVVVLGAVASPANAERGPTASCGSEMSGWVLVGYVPATPEEWRATGLYTTWAGWVDVEGWLEATNATEEETYQYLAADAAATDLNGDMHVCMKLATPVPTKQPTNVSPWLFDWDVFLLDNVRGPKG